MSDHREVVQKPIIAGDQSTRDLLRPLIGSLRGSSAADWSSAPDRAGTGSTARRTDVSGDDGHVFSNGSEEFMISRMCLARPV